MEKRPATVKTVPKSRLAHFRFNIRRGKLLTRPEPLQPKGFREISMALQGAIQALACAKSEIRHANKGLSQKGEVPDEVCHAALSPGVTVNNPGGGLQNTRVNHIF